MDDSELVQLLEELRQIEEEMRNMPIGRGGRDVQRDEDFLLPLVTDIPWPRWDYRGA